MRANQVSIGSAANTYTLAGVGSDASRAVQTGPLQTLTTDASGNTAGDGGALSGRIGRLEDQTDDALQGVAIAIALTGLHLPRPDEKFRMSFNLGHYEDNTALSASGAAQIADRV